MRRIVLAGIVSCLALAAGPTVGAQEAQRGDSARVAYAAAPADSVPIVVRVTSRRLPFMPGDLLMMNCSFSGDNGLLDALPFACTRHTTGTLATLAADSITFVRSGRTIRLAASDVKKLEQLTGRSALRTVGSAVMGGLTGVVGAGMIGIGGAYNNDATFVATAVVLGTAGAIIGGARGGSTWKEMPRSFEVPPTQRR